MKTAGGHSATGWSKASSNSRREVIIASSSLFDELLELIREDAEHFDSNAEVDHARIILARGTSADRQVALCRQQLDRGLAPSQALKAVVDHLIIETVAGTDDARNSSRQKTALRTPGL